MARQVKCPECQQFFIREDDNFVEHQKRFYHKECFDKKKLRSKQREFIFEELEEIGEVNYPHINKQITHFTKDLKFSLEGISKTIQYLVKIGKGDKLNKNIALVEYYYAKAIQYFYEKDLILASRKKEIKKSEEIKVSNQGKSFFHEWEVD